MEIIKYVLFLIFLALALIHLYWAAGGKWGIKNVIPRKPEEDPLSMPPLIATVLVAIGLFLFGLFYLNQTSLLTIEYPSWINWIAWVIPSIFLIRAVGDFKYAGLFKNIKDTGFAKMDTKLYSPLSLLLAILGYALLF